MCTPHVACEYGAQGCPSPCRPDVPCANVKNVMQLLVLHDSKQNVAVIFCLVHLGADSITTEMRRIDCTQHLLPRPTQLRLTCTPFLRCTRHMGCHSSSPRGDRPTQGARTYAWCCACHCALLVRFMNCVCRFCQCLALQLLRLPTEWTLLRTFESWWLGGMEPGEPACAAGLLRKPSHLIPLP